MARPRKGCQNRALKPQTLPSRAEMPKYSDKCVAWRKQMLVVLNQSGSPCSALRRQILQTVAQFASQPAGFDVLEHMLIIICPGPAPTIQESCNQPVTHAFQSSSCWFAFLPKLSCAVTSKQDVILVILHFVVSIMLSTEIVDFGRSH